MLLQKVETQPMIKNSFMLKLVGPLSLKNLILQCNSNVLKTIFHHHHYTKGKKSKRPVGLLEFYENIFLMLSSSTTFVSARIA